MLQHVPTCSECAHVVLRPGQPSLCNLRGPPPPGSFAGQGSITVPGCVAAAPVDAPIQVDSYTPALPLVLYTGHVSPSVNSHLYRFQVATGRVKGVAWSRSGHRAWCARLGLGNWRFSY